MLVGCRAYASVLQRPFFCTNESTSIIYYISFSSTHTILVCSWKMWARTTFTRSSELPQDWGSTHTHEQGKVWRTHSSLWHFFSTSDSRCPSFPNRLLERTQKRNAVLIMYLFRDWWHICWWRLSKAYFKSNVLIPRMDGVMECPIHPRKIKEKTAFKEEMP